MTHETAQLSALATTSELLTRKGQLSVVIGAALAQVLKATGLVKGLVFLVQPDGTVRLDTQIGCTDADVQAVAQSLRTEADVRSLLIGTNAELVALSCMRPEETGSGADLEPGLIFEDMTAVALLSAGRLQGAMVLASPRSEVKADLAATVAASAAQLASAVALSNSVTALTESETRYRAFFDSNPHPAWVLDADTLRFLDVNEAAVWQIGYSRDEFRSLSPAALDATPTDDLMTSLRSLIGSACAERTSIRLRDGRFIHADLSGWSIELGNRRTLIVCVTDVTERVNAERLQSARLAVAEALSTAKTEDDVKVQALTALCRAVGWSESRWLEKAPADKGWAISHAVVLREGQSTPTLRADVYDAAANEGRPVVIAPPTSAGEDACTPEPTRFVLPVGGPWPDHGLIELLDAQPRPVEGYLEQLGLSLSRQLGGVLDRKRAEAALRQSESRLTRLFNADLAGVIVADRDGRLVEANQQFLEMTGYRADQIAASLRLERVVEDPQAMTTLARSGAVCSHESVCVKSDGSKMSVLFGASRDPQSGETIALLLDLTAQQQLERQFLLAQRREVLGLLAGGVAHDFNNVLTVIGAYTEFLTEECPNQLVVQKNPAGIREAIARASALTRQLLMLSAREIGEPKELDVNEIVTGFERMARRILGSEVTVCMRLAPGLPPIHADRTQIEQVLLNLVVNARDAMPAGGTLTIATATCADKAATPPSPRIRLSVIDTGAGMSERVRARIFEPFFTTKEPGKGTGLGLSTAHRIVSRAGGTIAVHSVAGEGTKFDIDFPAWSGHDPAAADGSAAA